MRRQKMTEQLSYKSVSEEAMIKRMSCGFWISRILSIAVELDLFSKLYKKSFTLADISKILGTPLRSTKILLTACAALDLLNKNGDSYCNSRLADKFLVKEKPEYMGYEVMIAERMWNGMSKLSEAILNDSPTTLLEDREFYDDLAHKEREGFILTMHSQGFEAIDNLLGVVDFSKYTQLLDLGGGIGSYSMAITKKYPKIKAIIFDLPRTVNIAKKFVKQRDFSPNVEFQAGNFLKDEFSGQADVILLSRILHDWGKEECNLLLQKCFNYLPSKGLIIIHEEMLNDDETGPFWPAMLSVCILIMFKKGIVRSLSDNVSLLDSIGFVNIKTFNNGEISTIITGEKP